MPIRPYDYDHDAVWQRELKTLIELAEIPTSSRSPDTNDKIRFIRQAVLSLTFNNSRSLIEFLCKDNEISTQATRFQHLNLSRVAEAAAANGDIGLFKLAILLDGSSMSSWNRWMSLAAKESMIEVMEFCFQHGATFPSDYHRYNYTEKVIDWLTQKFPQKAFDFLCHYIRKNDITAKIHLCIKRCAPDQLSFALRIAAQYHHLPAMHVLVKAGADLDATTPQTGLTALHTAFSHLNNPLSVIVELIQQGANPNIQDVILDTPLHKAVRLANSKNWQEGFPIVRYLLENGASPNLQNNQQMIPFMLDNGKLLFDTIRFGTVDDLKCLVKAGIDLGQREAGKTPYQFAIHLNHWDQVDYLNSLNNR